jgi:hypothetical protein
MKALLIVIDPILGGKPLTQHYGVDVPRLYIDVLNDLLATLGRQYDMIQPVFTPDIPIKLDGYQYSPDEYLAVIQDGSKHHEPDLVDYWKFMDKYNLVQRRINGEFDEVHVYGGPFMGFHESQLVGMDAFYCNSAPIAASCKNFAIMGWNYERGVSEALEAYGHRTEFVFQYFYPQTWNKYSKEFGTIHVPFNGVQAYDWSNKTMGTFNGEPANCDLWGCDSREYMKWWLRHLPEAVKYSTMYLEGKNEITGVDKSLRA